MLLNAYPAIQQANGGQDIDSTKLYRVTFGGASPRHDGAIWQFSSRGKGGVVKGLVVWHNSPTVVNRMGAANPDNRTNPPYLTAKFSGLIEEVTMDPCVGWSTETCQQKVEWQNGSRVYSPEVLVRNAGNTDPARCMSCRNNQASFDRQQEAEAKKASIEDKLADAIARRAMPAADEPLPTFVPEAVVRQADVIVRAADSGHPLAHLIPPMEAFTSYVSRTVDGITDLAMMDYAFAKKENLLLGGPTETGKTALVEAWCAKNSMPLVTVSCHGGIDADSLFGLQKLTEDQRIAYLHSNVTKAMEHGGVVYWDEVNFTPQKVLAVLHAAMDARRQVTIADLGYETIKMVDQCMFVGTCNPGYAGTNEMNEATKRRFTIQRSWGYDESVEKQLVRRLPVLHILKEEIRKLIQSGDVTTPCGPKKLLSFENHAIDLSVEFGLNTFLESFKDEEREIIRKTIKDHHMEDLRRQVEAVQRVLQGAAA